jgi:DNA-entry nuclease
MKKVRNKSTRRSRGYLLIIFLAIAFLAYGKLSNLNTALISLDDIPEYSGKSYVEINKNVPFFEDEDTTREYEIYGELDRYGRCTEALACLGKSTMPKDDEKRESISEVKPSGWHTVKYDIVSGQYLYNRSHLIGWQLSAENDNEKNLITGTRYFNVTGMLPFENLVADYINETGGRVLYRVTPIYNANELVARGVLIEAKSADGGKSLEFCVFVYNVQPGIIINYLDGQSRLE